MSRVRALLFASLLLLPGGCSRAHEYELKGQVLAVDPSRSEITIRHDDIKGFMPGMTMPFRVRDARLLDGRRAGDLVTATLVVGTSDTYLSALAVTGHAEVRDPVPARRSPEVLETGDPVPEVTLVDERGDSRALTAWRGNTVAMTFIYTRCPLPDFCPRMDAHFREVQKAVMADPRLRGRVHLLSVSFDPDHDTPAVLAGHARRAGADPDVWTFATGTREHIDAMASRFGLSVIRQEHEVEIVHNLRTAVVGGDGRLVTIFSGNEWTPADLLASIRTATDGRR